jgi:plasmid stability protein
MSKMIQMRNVPDELHRTLKARAALEGRSLSDYLVAAISVLAERPSPAELRRRLAGRARVRPSRAPADLVREERDAR